MESANEKITVEIQKLMRIVDDLRNLSQGIPAFDRNLTRIAASVKMLELNFIDPGIEGGWRFSSKDEQ